MTPRALPNVVQKFRTDEATGTRPKENVSPERPVQALCVTARRLLKDGRARDALELLEREIATAEQNGEVHFWLGRAAFRLGDHVRAQRAFCRAIVLSPDDVQTQRWLARVLLLRGNPAGAMRVLMRRQDTSAAAMNELGLPVQSQTESPFGEEENEEPPTTQWNEEPPTTQWVARRRRQEQAP